MPAGPAPAPPRRAPRPAAAAGRWAARAPASARCAPARPSPSPGPGTRRPYWTPGRRRGRRRARRGCAASAALRPACPCRSCSSCTAHSTSASPPRPSLAWVAGSAPRGSRSVSTRALIRRISVICSGVSPPAGIAHPVGQGQEPRAQRRVAGDEAGPQQRLRLPDLRPVGVVALVRGEAAHQRTLPSLGAQVGVDAERRLRRRGGRAAGAVPRRSGAPCRWPRPRPRRAAARRRRARPRRRSSSSRPRRAGPCR